VCERIAKEREREKKVGHQSTHNQDLQIGNSKTTKVRERIANKGEKKVGHQSTQHQDL
jgi:hypothetical protein